MGEPLIRIGICPRSECHNVTTLPDGSRKLDIVIGRGFHWERKIDITLKGDISTITDGETRWIVASIPLERYLCSVISSEMNPEAYAEFLKAHAVISRSWAIGKISAVNKSVNHPRRSPDEIVIWWDTSSHSHFDVCSDDHCQRYQGEAIINTQALSAVEATRGEVLTDSKGNVADARFSKCCGGHTELFSTCWQDTDVDYLTAHADPFCDPQRLSHNEREAFLHRILKDYDAESTPQYYSWQADVMPSLIAHNLRTSFGEDVGDIVDIIPLKRGASGRIFRLRVEGTKKSIIIGKELAIRKLLSATHLLSSAFDIERGADYLRLRGKGWGHGVGLCQIGAAEMAREGYNYTDILSFYYPDTHIVRAY